MVTAESRMSLSKPSCFSSGINSHRRGEDAAAAIGIAAALDRCATHKIHRATEPLFQFFFQAAHFQKPDGCAGQELDQQIHIAFWMSPSVCPRAK